ncbi:MAG: DNA-3-methyladenine glycosylase [Acidimicrobiia bacterium]|nr:DNA-3-methyladenine glycosylase [Acidimicrobiia bacterium]MBT8215395.1 DNA-3-methyladenine glycosylase [Acidimicrobiia bacterium]NNF10807.1 DNA-3-methyladenine glycosylase [Acidimicrobiia bacterium]NNL70414.1 DNA-3-methyladenine glycosylase [Acidimicrobiia bacterium]
MKLARQLDGPVEDIAQHLLGRRIRTEFSPGPTEVVITEVEAYAGARDPASHAFRGQTPRNAAMFGPTGTLYVYRSYGIHWCMNVVTGGVDDPSAVLIRAGRPVIGADIMARRRGRADHLADGPGKLTQALGVTGDHDGTSVWDGPVRLLEGSPRRGHIIASPRVGISKAVAWPWRFVLVEG